MPMTRLRLGHFARDRRAVSAIEFSIWAPFMCLLLLGSVDITRYEIATGRLSDVASAIGQMLAVNTSGTVSYVDLQFYHDSAMITFPQVLADAAQQGIAWSADLAVTTTSVKFTATPTGCTTNCTYVPKVIWSNGSNKRSCTVTMTSTSDTATPSASTLPADVFGSTTLLVVDIVYTFRPLLSTSFIKPITIARSFYTPPRYVTTVAYQAIQGDPGLTSVCT